MSIKTLIASGFLTWVWGATPSWAQMVSHEFRAGVGVQSTRDKSRLKVTDSSRSNQGNVPADTPSPATSPVTSLDRSIKYQTSGIHTLAVSPRDVVRGQWSLEKDDALRGQERSASGGGTVFLSKGFRRLTFGLGLQKSQTKISDWGALPLGEASDLSLEFPGDQTVQDTQGAYLQAAFLLAQDLEVSARYEEITVKNSSDRLLSGTQTQTDYKTITAGMIQRMKNEDSWRLDLAYRTDNSVFRPEVYSLALSWNKRLTKQWFLGVLGGLDEVHTKATAPGGGVLQKNSQRSLQGKVDLSAVMPENTVTMSAKRSIDRRSLSNNLYEVETYSGLWLRTFRKDTQSFNLELSQAREKDLVFSDQSKPQTINSVSFDYGLALFAKTVTRKVTTVSQNGIRPLELFIDRLALGFRGELLESNVEERERQNFFLNYNLQI